MKSSKFPYIPSGVPLSEEAQSRFAKFCLGLRDKSPDELRQIAIEQYLGTLVAKQDYDELHRLYSQILFAVRASGLQWIDIHRLRQGVPISLERVPRRVLAEANPLGMETPEPTEVW